MNTIFKDINLKFGIISCLNDMGYYIAEAEKIKEAQSSTRLYREAPYSYIIREVYDYYASLEIPQELLDRVEIFQPGDKCYRLMVKEWDGEGNLFDIKYLDGLEQLHNLREFYTDMLDKDDPDITAILQCQKMAVFHKDYIEETETVIKVLKLLEEKGVSVI